MKTRIPRYTLQETIEPHDAYIGPRKKPSKQGGAASSKVPLMVGVESHRKGLGRMALRNMGSFLSRQAKSFSYQNVYDDSIILDDLSLLGRRRQMEQLIGERVEHFARSVWGVVFI